MRDMINAAADNIEQAFGLAHDRLSQPLPQNPRPRKAGPSHAHRKHRWDFTTLGATFFVRHGRRYANLGERGPAFTLKALAVPTGVLACTGIGMIPRVATATLCWSWWFGYAKEPSDASFRKDLVQLQLREAVAQLQFLVTYAQEHPEQIGAMRPVWQRARHDMELFERHLVEFDPKIGGSTRLRKQLRRYARLLGAHDGSKPG